MKIKTLLFCLLALAATSLNAQTKYAGGDLSMLTRNAIATDGMTIYNTLVGNYKVSIAANASVTLSNATITCGQDSEDYKWAGLSCLGNATITLVDENSVKGFHKNYPGIHIPSAPAAKRAVATSASTAERSSPKAAARRPASAAVTATAAVGTSSLPTPTTSSGSKPDVAEIRSLATVLRFR